MGASDDVDGRFRLPFRPLVPVLIVLVIAAAGGLMALLMLPWAKGAGDVVEQVNARLAFLGKCKKIGTFPERSTVYAADGKTVLANLYLDYNREIVHLADVSPIARRSVLAIEDDGFYQHGALNFPSILRALITNAFRGEVVQGGSTITQQLVKNAVTGNIKQTYERKFREAAIAVCLDGKYSKDKILELYLNDVFFGNNVYGIGTAADLYFNEPAAKLTLTQGALLAGLIQAPSLFDPLRYPKPAIARRNEVLDRLAVLGWVPQAKVDKAKQQPLGLAREAGTLHNAQPPFFAKYVVDEILGNASGEFDALGATAKQRSQTLYQGGLAIATTLDPSWQ